MKHTKPSLFLTHLSGTNLPQKIFLKFAVAIVIAFSISTSVAQHPEVKSLGSGSEFFVSPTGSSSGDGSESSPWDLKTAFSHPDSVNPGDTIWLRGGTYNVPLPEKGFRSTLNGTEGNPIIVRSYPGEWAKIDGNLEGHEEKNVTIFSINGSYTWFMNFEITNSEVDSRVIPQSGSNPPGRRGSAVSDFSIGSKLINLVIHDAGSGISAWKTGMDNEYYGNIVYNNGWDAPDRKHGHGNYVQNISGTKKFEENIILNSFSKNTHMYGSQTAGSRNVSWIGNIFANGGMAWWGHHIVNLKVRENFTYAQHFQLGGAMRDTNVDAVVEDNYFASGVYLEEFQEKIRFVNNTVFYRINEPNMRLRTQTFWAPSKFEIDHNTYYRSGRIGPTYAQIHIDYRGRKQKVPIVKRYTGWMAFNRVSGSQQDAYEHTKKSWKDDFGFDKNSTYIDSSPSQTEIFVRPNKYASGRANVVVYNWALTPVVDVDPGEVLEPGDTYELRNGQDYFGDVITGTYTGDPIKIGMTERTIAKPVGDGQVDWYHDPNVNRSFPEFGVFVLIKTN